MFFNKKMAVSQIPVGHVPFSLKIQHEDIDGLLFCPFESRTSPFIAEVQGFGKSWAMMHGLIEAGTHLYEKLEMAAVDN